MSLLKRINWTNTIFLVSTFVIAVIATPLLIMHGLVSWPTWVLFGVMLALTGLAITGGYHRLFSHKSYQSHWSIRLLFALFGAAAFEGSILEWSTDHRNHHRYTDTDKDPYSIKKGFWYAHIGWLFVLDTKARDFSNVEDLAADPIVRLQHRYYPLIAIFMGFIFPMLVGALWGNAIGGLLIAGVLRITLNQHFTFCINSVCHLWGKRTYSDRQSAQDNWVTALFTYGEGFHNFHHQFPIDYRNGIRFYHFDPTKWLIRGLSYLRLATDLKRVSAHRIIEYRIRMDKQRLLQQAELSQESWLTYLSSHMGQFLKPVYDRMSHLLKRVEELEKGYEQLKKVNIENVTDKMHEYSQRIKDYRANLKQARKELKYTVSLWTSLIQYNAKKQVVRNQ